MVSIWLYSQYEGTVINLRRGPGTIQTYQIDGFSHVAEFLQGLNAERLSFYVKEVLSQHARNKM